MSLEKLFNPKSIAIVGASSEVGKVGNVIAKNICELGYAGKIYLINPKYKEIFGRKCYGSLVDIKDEIDLTIIAIPAKFVNQEIKNNAKKIKNYVVISAGFSEIGKEGKKQEEDLAKIAKENKLNILGPNCLGFIIPSLKLNASFAGGMVEKGNISFVSQSGALAVAFIDKAKEEGMKFSNIISIGNKMQISETELLEFLAKDKHTKIIGMYLEGIKDGKNFIKIAQEVSKIKPIIILKAGKNEKTQKAISSHTGALAGDDDVISAILDKIGIIRASNLEEFFNLINLVNNSKKKPNKESIIITNAGGLGVLTADAFSKGGIQLMDLEEEVKKELHKFLPAEASVENPVDLLGDATSDRYKKTLAIVSKIKEIGSVICLLTPQDQTPVLEIANEIIKFKKKTDKLVATVFLGGKRVEEAIGKLKDNEVCNFSFPDSAVSTINQYYHWKKLEKSKIKSSHQITNVKRKERVLAIIRKAKAENRTALYFSESREVMEMYGVNTAECLNILPKNNSDAIELDEILNTKIKYPVVLKVDSDKVLHKTDKQGLILNIENKKQLREAVEKMQASFFGSRLIIQSMAKKGTELIIGIKKDENFGSMIVFGLGGIYTEIFKMVDYLVPPLNLGQVENSLLEGKLKFLFSNTRGQKPYKLEELAKAILGISFMALEIQEVCEFDINPFMIYNDNNQAVALDVKIVI